MAPLSTPQLSSIVSLLTEESLKKITLEELLHSARKSFERFDCIKVCSVLTVLLQQRDLLPCSSQRLAALTLLHQLPHTEGCPPPFLPQMLHMLNDGKDDSQLGRQDAKQGIKQAPVLTVHEKRFLSALLTEANVKQLLKRRPTEVLSWCESNMSGGPAAAAAASRTSRPRELHTAQLCGVPLLLPAQPPLSAAPDDRTASASLRAVVLDGREAMAQVFTPAMLRPAPPLYATIDQMVWLESSTAGPEAPVTYDASLCVNSEGDAEARRLMTRAFKETLSIPQLQHLLAHLEREPALVYRTGLTPKNLSVLVEHNPLIAIEFLLKVMQTSHITEYLNVLVNMEMSLHSMEVVNRLTTAAELPHEFVHMYINNCIKTCRGIKDRYMQNRLVRLVCVFLQSLIRNKIINVQDLFVEVQIFCLDFSRIREAAALYKLLKQLNSAEAAAPATPQSHTSTLVSSEHKK